MKNRCLNMIFTVLMILGLLPALPTNLNATITGLQEPVTIELKDASIRDVLTTMSHVAGIQVSLDECVRGTVTLEMENVPFDIFLESVLETADLTWSWDGEILMVDCQAGGEHLEPLSRKEKEGSLRVEVEIRMSTPAGKNILLYSEQKELASGDRIEIRSTDFDPPGNVYYPLRLGPKGTTYNVARNELSLQLALQEEEEGRKTLRAVYTAILPHTLPDRFIMETGSMEMDNPAPMKQMIIEDLPFKDGGTVSITIRIPGN